MIDIKLFGPTVVLVDGVPLGAAELGGLKPRRILEMLALELGTPVSKDRLADRLWENQPPAAYVATIESYVCVVRRKLGVASGKQSVLATTNSGYLLDPEGVRVDYADFRALLAQAATEPDPVAVELVDRALGLMSGELLVNEPYETWAEQERQELSDLIAVACTRGAQIAGAAGDTVRAVRLARVAADQGFFSETPWQELIRALWTAGRRAEALRAYADLRAGMLDELGIEPGPVSQALYMEVLRGVVPGRCRSADRHENRHEVRTLIRLLRQALEAGTGIDAYTEPGVSEVARVLLRNPA